MPGMRRVLIKKLTSLLYKIGCSKSHVRVLIYWKNFQWERTPSSSPPPRVTVSPVWTLPLKALGIHSRYTMTKYGFLHSVVITLRDPSILNAIWEVISKIRSFEVISNNVTHLLMNTELLVLTHTKIN